MAIRLHIGLLLVRTLRGCLHFRIKVQGGVRKLLLCVTHNLALQRGDEVLHHVHCEATSHTGARWREAVLSRKPRRCSWFVQRHTETTQHRQATHKAGALNVSNMICVMFSWLASGFRRSHVEQHNMFLGRHSILIVESVVPELLHAVLLIVLLVLLPTWATRESRIRGLVPQRLDMNMPH